MMLPLVPEELLTTSVVDLVVARWDSAFPERRGLFEKLRRHILRNYVGTSARFPVHLWSVSGRATRTNNAAESSHARLNASVRVSCEVSIDLFLFRSRRR